MRGIGVRDANMADLAALLESPQVIHIVQICIIGKVPSVIWTLSDTARMSLLFEPRGKHLHCSRSILVCPMRFSARSTAASAFSNVLIPFSWGHHLVNATFFVVNWALCCPMTSSCEQMLASRLSRLYVSSLTSISIVVGHIKCV